MKFACVSSMDRGETDRLLTKVSERLRNRNVALAGIVKQLQAESHYENGCEMMVSVLPDGPAIQITQDLGAGSDACRLDPSAIADAVSRVEGGELDAADLFILNKFGPEEAAGRGFVSAIGTAVENDIPVLVGVGATSTAFDSFAGGLAEKLPPDLDRIEEWCLAAIANSNQD